MTIWSQAFYHTALRFNQPVHTATPHALDAVETGDDFGSVWHARHARNAPGHLRGAALNLHFEERTGGFLEILW